MVLPLRHLLPHYPRLTGERNLKEHLPLQQSMIFSTSCRFILLLPIQIYTNFLGVSASMMGEVFANVGGMEFLSPVKALTKPMVLIVKELVGPDLPWLMLTIALGCLFASLKYMVDSLKILVVSKAKVWFDRYLFKTSIRAFLVGLLLTIMVQSSSITVSLMVPMAGAGILTLIQIFPYTLGANIGTTVTAILAALITGNTSAIVVAFSHSLFNICGLIIGWPLKKIPILLHRSLRNFQHEVNLFRLVLCCLLFSYCH